MLCRPCRGGIERHTGGCARSSLATGYPLAAPPGQTVEPPVTTFPSSAPYQSALQPRTARIVLATYLGVLYSTLGVVRRASNFFRDRGKLRPLVLVIFVLAVATLLLLILREPFNRSWRVVTALAVSMATYAAIIVPLVQWRAARRRPAERVATTVIE